MLTMTISEISHNNFLKNPEQDDHGKGETKTTTLCLNNNKQYLHLKQVGSCRIKLVLNDMGNTIE